MRRYILIMVLAILAALAGYWATGGFSEVQLPFATYTDDPSISRSDSPSVAVSTSQTVKPSVTTTPSGSQQILLNVPFMSQAPFGEWSDDRFQDGCEEASVYMAISWLRGKTSISASEAKNEIIKVSAWEAEHYDTYHDTSAKDTGDRLINQYYGHKNYSLKYDINKQDIIDALKKGNAVITPMDGQKLDNPNFTPPGPERHMVIVIGYDPAKDQFITNDPGTRNGRHYRYEADHYISSIRDYPSGHKVPITSVRKAMIVISK